MYNLLKVSSQSQDEWEQNQGHLYDVSFLSGRVFEYTDKAIEHQFTGSDGPDFDALRKTSCRLGHFSSSICPLMEPVTTLVTTPVSISRPAPPARR